jgi:hypothetical protein
VVTWGRRLIQGLRVIVREEINVLLDLMTVWRIWPLMAKTPLNKTLVILGAAAAAAAVAVAVTIAAAAVAAAPITVQGADHSQQTTHRLKRVTYALSGLSVMLVPVVLMTP